MVKPYTHGQFGGLRFDWDQGGVGSERQMGEGWVKVSKYETIRQGRVYRSFLSGPYMRHSVLKKRDGKIKKERRKE